MSASTPLHITHKQKLLAIDYKYYQGLEWSPKEGDYYVLTRAPLELYRIIGETDDSFAITVIWSEFDAYQSEPSYFKKDGFLAGFGENRVQVPPFIFKTIEE